MCDKPEYHSAEVAEILLRLIPKLEQSSHNDIVGSFRVMGAACLFDDFENPEEAAGALKVLKRLETDLDSYG